MDHDAIGLSFADVQRLRPILMGTNVDDDFKQFLLRLLAAPPPAQAEMERLGLKPRSSVDELALSRRHLWMELYMSGRIQSLDASDDDARNALYAMLREDQEHIWTITGALGADAWLAARTLLEL